MEISILVFDGITSLDAIGPYEVLRSVPGWNVSFVGKQPGEFRADSGSLGLIADHGSRAGGRPAIGSTSSRCAPTAPSQRSAAGSRTAR